MMRKGIWLVLVLSLCACSTPKEIVVTKTQIVREKVPTAYLRSCPTPKRPIMTTGDIVDLLTATRGALEACNSQIAKVRKWNG